MFQIACAADARYLPHCAAMIRSVLTSNPETPVEIHLLHGDDLGPADMHGLETMLAGTTGSLSAHAIDPRAIGGLPAWEQIPTTMWYRILLPEMLPDVDRILYVDVDVLVVDSLAPLWAIDLDGCYLGAVTNVPERHMLGHAAELGLPGAASYFNSGVLLMNLELMRREESAAALRECALRRREELLWPDQDALNLVLSGHRLALHPRWNLMNSIRTFDWSGELLGEDAVVEAIRNPAIVHFEGPRENKPWHVLCTHPLRSRYVEHRRQTPWPAFRPDGVTAGNLLRLAARRVRPRRDADGTQALTATRPV